jgi:hypothetical protein
MIALDQHLCATVCDEEPTALQTSDEDTLTWANVKASSNPGTHWT